MQVLGDLATPEEIEALRKGFDVEGLLRLVQAESTTIAGMALDSLAEELGKGGLDTVTQVADAGGLDLLIRLTSERRQRLSRLGSRAGQAGAGGPGAMGSTTQSVVERAAKEIAAAGAGGGGGGSEVRVGVCACETPHPSHIPTPVPCLATYVSHLALCNCRTPLRSGQPWLHEQIPAWTACLCASCGCCAPCSRTTT